MEAPAPLYERPSLRIAFWGQNGPAVNQAAAAEIALCMQAWHVEQRRRQEAEQLAGLVRDRVLEGSLAPAALRALLADPAPPALKLRGRIAAALRALFPPVRKGAIHHA
ncbi:hypothetical protein QTI33_03690 [Variovorax sp. J22P271]|uniref:hypothetical protein n=1 Tax=Variovorax davisae TaxID=3053515 RepID=UPI0025750A26|nr:hypothetical protein [Variovorax sp. J22P271]MDM0031237.1 hypothetical protein [Variovorax sp. J22P271]